MSILARTSDGANPIDEINVTPFVDVLLVLLIVFMITAPLLTKTLAVDIPEENVNAPVDKSGSSGAFAINEKGEFFHLERKIGREEVSEVLGTWKGERSSMEVSIWASENAKYKAVASLMAVLRNEGVQKINLVVKSIEK